MRKMPLLFDRMRLLIIEDEDDTRRMLRSMLMEMGIADVAEAVNGRDGLDTLLLGLEPVDAVLCDWNLPIMNGLDILRRARQQHIDRPFLMITGRGDSASVTEAKEAGVSAYLHKPLDMNQLEAKLRVIHHRHCLSS